MLVSKDALNTLLIHSSAKGSFRNAKFSNFSKNFRNMHFGRQINAKPSSPLWLRYCSASRRFLYLSFINARADNPISHKDELGKAIIIFKAPSQNIGYSFA